MAGQRRDAGLHAQLEVDVAKEEDERASAPPEGVAQREAEARSAARRPGVAGLLTRLSVERTASGGLRIEAPPETAEVLASLFEGVAEALRAASR